LKKQKVLRIFFAFLFFILLWQGLSLLIRRPFFPCPGEAAASLGRLAKEGKLGRHLGASLSRVLWALMTGCIPAAFLGIVAGRFPWLNSLISPAIYLLHPLPKAAFLPVIMLFLGLGETSKIFLLGITIFSHVLVTMRDSAKQVPPELLDSVRSMGAGKAGLLRHVILPAVLPGFFTAFRVSLGTAIAVLFLAETFAAESGLGYLIVDAWTRVAYAEMYAAILALSLLGLLFFALTDFLEKILCRGRII
jgi:NitT/TauT family transport system permease protein